MILQEGHYYRDRHGDVIGPLVKTNDEWYPFGVNIDSWTSEGRLDEDGETSADLVSEVFVSDHPAGLFQIKPDGTMEPVVSLRMQIAIAAMQGLLAHGGYGWSAMALDAFAMADALIEQEGK